LAPTLAGGQSRPIARETIFHVERSCGETPMLSATALWGRLFTRARKRSMIFWFFVGSVVVMWFSQVVHSGLSFRRLLVVAGQKVRCGQRNLLGAGEVKKGDVMPRGDGPTSPVRTGGPPLADCDAKLHTSGAGDFARTAKTVNDAPRRI
jgi:hypothetical protein